MNLFLGHDVPSRHQFSLWDLEHDFYLHNFHIKSGTNTMESMELHQHTFSSHLEDDDPSHKDNRSDVGVGGGVSTPLVRRKMATHSHGHHGHQRRLSIPSSSFKDAEGIKNDQESWRVTRIRNRCAKQYEEGLSLWWRHAIQAYIEQRCWMHIRGNNRFVTSSSALQLDDEWFEFDRYFSRVWGRPLFSNMLSKNNKAFEEEKEAILLHRKHFPQRKDDRHKYSSSKKEEEEEDDEARLTVKEFSQKFGYKSEAEAYLSSFLKEDQFGRISRRSGDEESKSQGQFSIVHKSHQKYIKYVQPRNQPFRTKDREEIVRKEFSNYLQDSSIESDNVQGMLSVSGYSFIIL